MDVNRRHADRHRVETPAGYFPFVEPRAPHGTGDEVLDAVDSPMLRAALDAMVDAVTVSEAVRDDAGRIVDFRIRYANRAARDLGGRRTDELVGRLWSERDPGAVGGPVMRACAEAVDTDVPVRWSAEHVEQVGPDGTRDERWIDLHAVRVGDGCIASWRDATERTRVEHDLRRALDDLHEAERLARIGSWHVEGGSLRSSWGLAELLGLPARVTLDGRALRTAVTEVGADGARLLREVIRRIARGTSFEIDGEVVDSDGAAHWVVVRGEPRVKAAPGGSGGRVEHGVWSGTVQDVTQLRRLRDLVAALRETQRELHDERDRLDLALEAGRMGRFEWDAASGVVTWDSRLEALFGCAPGEFDGTIDAWLARVHPDDRQLALDALDTAARHGGGPFTFDHRALLPDGRIAWLEGRGMLTVGPDGAPTGARGVTSDVTGRKQNELSLARAREHLAVLDRAVMALTSSFDVTTSLRELGSVVVPGLADLCEIDLVADGGFTRVVIDRDDDIGRAREMTSLPDVDWHPVRRVVATGTPMIVDIDTAPELFGPPDVPTSARAMGIEAAVLAPLAIRNQVLGSLTLGRTGERPRWTEADLRLATQLAERTALAIDNARLFTAQRDLVERLQLALLPDDLAATAWADVAVRYRAALEGMQVGGDWYDVVVRRDGVMAVTVGDVVGHGVDAAVLMNRLRNRLRLFLADATSPIDTLARLDAGSVERMAGDFATVVVAMFDDRGTLTVATAGHPPPLILEPRVPARYLDVTAGPPIGVAHQAARSLVRLSLAPGGVVVFFTDGLVERRGESIEVGLERLRSVCDVIGVRSADDVADAILLEMLPSGARDDVALCAVRWTGAASGNDGPGDSPADGLVDGAE